MEKTIIRDRAIQNGSVLNNYLCQCYSQNGIWFRLSCGFNVDSSEIEKIKKEIDLFLE
jgi:hypothetical protein